MNSRPPKTSLLPQSREVLRNAVWNTVPFAWSMVISLATTAYVVRTIGLTHFGVYGLLNVLITPLGLANLGFSVAGIKFFAKYSAERDLDTARRYLETVLWMATIVGASGAALITLFGAEVMFALFQVSDLDKGLIEMCVFGIAFTWFFQQLAAPYASVPVAINKYRYVAYGTVAIQTIAAVLQVVFLFFGFGLIGVVMAVAIAAMLGFLIWCVIAHRVSNATPSVPRLHREIWKVCFQIGGWQALGQSGGILATTIERFIFGFFLTPAALGIYNAVLKLEQSLVTAVYRMSEVFFPYFSARDASQMVEKAPILFRASWLLSAVSVSLLCPLIPLADQILHAWVGAEVASQGAVILITMTVGGMLASSTNTINFFLLAEGKTKWIASYSLLHGILSCLGALVLLPRYGLSSAALAGTLAVSLRPFILHWMMRQLFEDAISKKMEISSIYLPVLVALSISWIASYFTPPTVGVVGLATEYVAISATTMLVVVLVGLITPGGKARVSDIATVIDEIRRNFRLGKGISS